MGRNPGMETGIPTGLITPNRIPFTYLNLKDLNRYLPLPSRMAGMVLKIRTISSLKDQWSI
jgi:hypothetical protein